MIRDLSTNSWLLMSLNDTFQAIDQYIQIISCYETNETPTVEEDDQGNLQRSGKPCLMVDSLSACLFTRNELRISVHANHSAIAKFTKSPGSAYLTIREKLDEIIKAAHLDPKRDSPEAFGLRSPLLGVTARLQAACSKAYRLLTPGSLLLLVEMHRFDAWRTEFFRQKRMQVLPDPTLIDLALRVLEDKVSLLGDFFRLQEEFGVHFHSVSTKVGFDSQIKFKMGHSDHSSTNWHPQLAARTVAIHEKLDAAQLLTPEISDMSKHEALFHKVRATNDTLLLLLPQPTSVMVDQTAVSSLIRALDERSLKELEQMAMAVPGLDAISCAAAMRLWTLQVSKINHMPTPDLASMKYPFGTVKCEGNIYTTRTPAKFTPPGGTALPVLIEWKYSTRKDDDFEDMIFHQEMEDISRLLNKTPKPEGFKTLRCLGYFEEKGRVGLIYEPPPIAEGRTDSISLSSLLTLADDDMNNMPVLGDRFRLAYSLANAISEFHSMGWLHKNINSDNILFFSGQSSSAVAVSSPFIVGFDHSRHIESKTRPATITNVYERYCHPSYLSQKNFASGYRRKYDVYSLGLVLFEIGVWEPLESFDDVQQSRDYLCRAIMSDHLQQLAVNMGSTYRDVVVTCISGSYWEFDDKHGTQEEQVEFRRRVLRPLERIALFD
ncbi:hypothetical protein BDD12DRAFT_385735 [Trichophaea hybrida]|nr:hypothetical protein BDD12DRAFT_385735 [Trichophaea hybrida]